MLLLPNIYYASQEQTVLPHSIDSRRGYVTYISQRNVNGPTSHLKVEALRVSVLHYVFLSDCPDDQQCSR